VNPAARAGNDPCMNEKDPLDDSWFDLPVLDLPDTKRQRQPEDDLDDSWFDRPGRGIKRRDVLDR